MIKQRLSIYWFHTNTSIKNYVTVHIGIRNSHPQVLVAWQQVHVWLGKLILVDVTSMGFHVHWLHWLWIDLTPFDLLQWTYDLVPWPKGFIVNAILDLKCMSQMVQHDDHSSLAIVNKLGQPHATLPTIMNCPSLHNFCDDDFDMIWDSTYYCWVEPNVDECAMGFHS